jgi:hypothetical protein
MDGWMDGVNGVMFSYCILTTVGRELRRLLVSHLLQLLLQGPRDWL